jgi:hypothetical protein
MDQPKLFISIFIILVIGLHALPVLQRLQGESQTVWPVMAWGMYRNSRNPGPIQTRQTRLIGTTSTGNEFEIDSEFSGLSFNALTRLYLRPMREGDDSAARQLADRLNRHREDPFVAFRMENETYTVTDSGIVKEHKPATIYRVVD